MSQIEPTDLDRDVDRGPLNWSAVAAAVLVAGLQVYEGLGPAWAGNTPAIPSLFLGAILVGGAVLFVTNYWRPALYLPGAVIGLYVFVVSLLDGVAVEPTNLATAVGALLLGILCLASFYHEEVAYLSDQPHR